MNRLISLFGALLFGAIVVSTKKSPITLKKHITSRNGIHHHHHDVKTSQWDNMKVNDYYYDGY